jgi:VWFA-related protein
MLMNAPRPTPADPARFVAGLAMLPLALLVLAPWAVPAAGQTFRSAIDLIAVDVQVRDRLGNPVRALSADKFTVTIDGRKRRVVSADLARFEVSPTSGMAWPASNGQLNPISVNGPTGDGRTFIVAVDTSSFRALDVNMALSAGGRFVRGLLPDDAVGVFQLPHGPYLEPTTSHTAALTALNKIVGTKASSQSQMDMSIEQVIDITAAAATQPLLTARTTVGQLVSAPAESADGPPIDCPGTRVACTEAAIAEAAGLATSFEEEVFQGIQGLDSLLRRLRATPVRKTVLLFSAGMPVADRSGGRPSLAREVRLLGEQAAYANATINTVYFDTNIINEFSLESRRPKSSTGRTRVINTRALAEFTEPSGGALIEVGLGSPDREIDKLLAEISTYYVLGVEPETRDRDGRPHRLDVKVAERNVRLRSRQLVIIPAGNN